LSSYEYIVTDTVMRAISMQYLLICCGWQVHREEYMMKNWILCFMLVCYHPHI